MGAPSALVNSVSGSAPIHVREDDGRYASLVALAARLLRTPRVFVAPAQPNADEAPGCPDEDADVAQARACVRDDAGLAPDGRVLAVRLGSGEVLGAVADGEARFTEEDRAALCTLAAVQGPTLEARVLEAVGEALLVTDADGHCRLVNAEAARLFDAPRHTLRHADDCVLFPESPLQEILDRARETHRPVAFDGYSTRLGRHLAVRAYPFEQGLAVYFRDVTEERAAAYAVEAARVDATHSLAQLDALFAHLREGVVLVDPATGRGRCNPSAMALLGLTDADVSAPLGLLTSRYHVFDLDGVPVPGDARPYARLMRGERFDGLDLRVQPVRGGDELVLRYRSTPVPGPEGVPWLLLLSFQNVTPWYTATAALEAQQRNLAAINAELEAHVEVRTAELARVNVALERRMVELQDFTFIASHDMQEPLRKIQAFAELVGETTELPEDAQAYLGRVRTSAAHMSRLLSDLLQYTRIGAFERPLVPVPLARTFARLQNDFRDRITRYAATVDIGPLPAVLGDDILVRRLFEQLVANALHFRAETRPTVLSVHEVPAPEGFAAVTVQDNGIGFDEKYLVRMFKPLQRLHARGTYPGTGMGLAIATRIAERLGGTLTARSVMGQGSAFTVTLPRADET